MTKLPQCSETARHGSAYMGRSAKVAVDVDAQVTNDADWYHGSTTNVQHVQIVLDITAVN